MTRIRKRKGIAIILIVLGLIIVVRLALPYVILHYANNTLEEMDGYNGHVNDIDLAVMRGAYKLDSIYINKVDTLTQKETLR